MSLINTQVKPFKATAFHNGKFVDLTEASLKGKWSVFVFYPADFTFVCPTELEDLAQAMAGADVFLGLSVAGIVSQAMVKSMARDAIVFAMANPVPEIMPDLAKEAGARVVATGRSDFPNQVNNVLGFPGIFRGALDVRASDINEPMKIAASWAIAGLVEKVSEESIIPSPLDRRVVPAVAEAVARAAIKSGVARRSVDPEEVRRNAERMVEELEKSTCASR